MFSTFSRKVTSAQPVFNRQHNGVLLGWAKATGPNGGRAAVTYDGDAPLLSCATTGAGKGRGVLIPNMLTYPGPMIAVDIKGGEERPRQGTADSGGSAREIGEKRSVRIPTLPGTISRTRRA